MIFKYQIFTKNPITNKRMTVGSFAKQNPKGTFYIIVKRHAFTMIDGKVIGNSNDGSKKKPILSAYKVTKKRKAIAKIKVAKKVVKKAVKKVAKRKNQIQFDWMTKEEKIQAILDYKKAYNLKRRLAKLKK